MKATESEQTGVLITKVRLRIKNGEIEVTAKIRAKGGYRNKILWALDTKDKEFQSFEQELGGIAMYFSPEKR